MTINVLRPSFSCFTRNGLFSAVSLYLCLMCLLLAPTISIANTTQDDLKALQKALASSSNRNETFTRQLNNLDAEIIGLKAKLVTAAKTLTSLDQNLVDVEQRLADIKQVEDDTLDDLSKRNEELAATLSALVNLSRQPEGTIIGNPTGLIDSLRTSALLRNIIPTLKDDADQLAQQLKALENLRADYSREKAEFENLRKIRLIEQKSLDQLIAAKKSAQSKLAGVRNKEQKRLNELTANVRSTTALMEKLAQDRRKAKAAEEKRLQQEISRKEAELKKQREKADALAKAEKQQTPEAAVAASEPVEKKQVIKEKPVQVARAGIGKRFREAKGTLPLPVGGRIVSNYNESKKAGQQKGIVIESRPEAAVISPFDGQIAFAGPFRHYGLLLIIDHGDGFHTLLAGLGSIEGAVGQLLLAGEPVGQMKKSSKEKPKLYMELRSKGSPINPGPWLMANNRKVSG
ncbi:peptidoglycan DD-metalloendopeptidase family protein [Sneathiella marina]|uniref:Peptidoglycan DD-metalloendopeptidase family protein n=1 Tax=Sneathiella marina TaxID=2950108 RepID=A0ABY4W3B8_9PROT|nr:peptidoglycan DD-metalloendopeptidase family protein [Sneathiella marina]USG61692.1 peptidoglycan DD-metalloendopeptidase family protein [Sneathiella marina]